MLAKTPSITTPALSTHLHTPSPFPPPPHPLKPPPLLQEMMSNSEVFASANNTSKDEDNHMLNFEDTDRDLGPTTPGQC